MMMNLKNSIGPGDHTASVRRELGAQKGFVKVLLSGMIEICEIRTKIKVNCLKENMMTTLWYISAVVVIMEVLQIQCRCQWKHPLYFIDITSSVKRSWAWELWRTTFCGLMNFSSTGMTRVEAFLMTMVAKRNTSFTIVTTVHTPNNKRHQHKIKTKCTD